jgi:hypothetical protein
MGRYGPDVKCPCPSCYACGGAEQGCQHCSEGVRCTKRGFSKCGKELLEAGKEWGPGAKVTRRGTFTISCKLDMEPAQ